VMSSSIVKFMLEDSTTEDSALLDQLDYGYL